jgi:tight adherence protein C
MRTLSVCSLLVILFLSMNVWAQSKCLSDFNDISLSCIATKDKPFLSKPIPLGKLSKDSIFFYKTPAGELGKLKILSITNKPQKECSVFIDALTYVGNNEAFAPNSSLSISPQKNYWLSDKIYLDREGGAALILEKISQEEIDQQKIINGEVLSKKEYTSEQEQARSKALCVLVPTKGTEYLIHFVGSNEEKKIKVENPTLLYASLVLIFVAIFLIVRVFIEDQDKYKTQEVIEEAESYKEKSLPLFLRITIPFYKRYFLPIIQSSKHRQTFKNRYRQKIANAGLSKDLSPEEFVALKFFMILGGPFAFLAVRYIMEADWLISLTPVMGIIGFFYPNIWLSGMVSKRSDEVLRAMPFIVDMLALSVEAGLDFIAAIQRVIEKAPQSALVEEFETLIKEIKIGSSRADGLRQLSWRVNVIEINSFCATLVAADSVGASIAPLLKQLSAEIRVKRTARAEQMGATAATKILFPMILFILPAVLVAIFAPMLLKMISGKI